MLQTEQKMLEHQKQENDTLKQTSQWEKDYLNDCILTLRRKLADQLF